MSRTAKQRKKTRRVNPGAKLGLVAALMALLAISSTVFLNLNKKEPPRLITLAGLTL